jgi:hypothetical protein
VVCDVNNQIFQQQKLIDVLLTKTDKYEVLCIPFKDINWDEVVTKVTKEDYMFNLYV